MYPSGITSKIITGQYREIYFDRVTGEYLTRPKRGWIYVYPAVTKIRVNATNLVYDLSEIDPQRVPVDENGWFEFEAIVTDQPGISPNNGWTYRIVPSWGEQIANIPILTTTETTININQFFDSAEVPGYIITKGDPGRGILDVTSAGNLATVHYTDGLTDTFELPIGDGTGGSTPDATTSVKGKILIAGDLTGTASNIVIGDDKITSTKLDPTVRVSLGKAETAVQPAGLTKTAVGLSNVDNTADIDKPVSNATQTALNLKVNITSLHPVATSGSYADLSNKPTIPTTKSDIGLGNVDNTSDLNKPISSATQTALDGKSAIGHTHSDYIKTVNGVAPDGNGAVTTSATWDTITGKPSTFPPTVHTHSYDDLTDVPTEFTPTAHTHLWAHITDKPTTFTPATHTHAYSDLTGIPSTFAPSAHTHVSTEISDSTATGRSILVAASGSAVRTIIGAGTSNLAIGTTGTTAAAGNHVHDYSSLTGIPSTFTPSAHTHAISDSTGLQTALDGKAATVHTHAISDVTGLEAALSNKANTNDLTTKADLVGGKIPTSQIPNESLIRAVFVDDTAEMLALTIADVQNGDIARIIGESSYYTLIDDSNIDDINSWFYTPAPTGGSETVLTVNGQVGDVVLGKSDVGLGNVDNTSDLNKPISNATQTALDGKSDTGHTHTGVYEPVITAGSSGQYYKWDKTFGTINVSEVSGAAPLASPAFTGTPTGITKAHVGLSNVDNTSDSNKPISTATQTALDGKAPLGFYQKDAANVSTALLDWQNDSASGYLLHLTTGANTTAANAALAIGTDRGLGSGLLVSHKNGGRGIDIGVQPTAGSGMQIIGRSTAGFPLRVMLKPASLPVSFRAESGAPFADGVTTNGSNVFTSATAAFVAGDVGKTLIQLTSKGSSDPIGTIPAGTTITAVNSATSVTMSQNATFTATDLLFEVGGRLVPDSQSLVSIQGEDSATYTTMSKQGVSVKGSLTNVAPLIVSRKASQTSPILQIRDESFNTLAQVGKNGHFITSVTTVLATGDVSSNNLGFYLDATAGAAKLKIAGKDSAGTYFNRAVIDDTDTRLTDARTPTSHTHATSEITGLDSALTAKAPLASPTFTGTPAAPTATGGTNTTQIATTQFVQSALSSKANTSHTHLWADITDKPSTFAPSAHTHAISEVTGLDTALSGKEPTLTAGTTAQYYRGDKTWQTLNATAVGLGNVTNESKSTMFSSPTFTGTPVAPTATAGTNNTQIATTAYVDTGLATKAASSHTHAIADTTGLQTALDAKAPLASPAFTGTPTGITKTHVGLGSVDNTSDATKNSAAVTLTNKTISGSANTLSNIAQSSVTNLTTDLAAKVAKAGTATTLWAGTQAQYDAIGTKDSGTVYIVTA